MSKSFSVLEVAILKSKGATDEIIAKFAELEINSKESFAVVGDAATLAAISGLSEENATAIMEWAGVGATTENKADNQQTANSQPIVVEDSSVVKCTHCNTKQPHDYKSGDLCTNCGKQAEAIAICYWCHATGSGKFCRSCGAEYVKNLDYEIAVLLKREGVSKREIAKELAEMDDSEKETRITQLRSGRY